MFPERFLLRREGRQLGACHPLTSEFWDFSCTSGAGASVFQVEAKRALAVEGASRVHAIGADGAGVLLALIHI